MSDGGLTDSPNREDHFEAGAAWYAVAVLMVAYTFSFIDRSILTLLVGPIRQDLGITDTQFSLLHGLAFAIFYTGLGIPIARLADRHSRRIIIAVGIVVWSLATAACGIARGFGQLFGARVAVGVGEAALSPAAYSMIADMFPRERLGRALGVYNTGVFLGAGLALIIGGAVVAAVAGTAGLVLPMVGEVRGWQVVFFAVGFPGILVALLVMTLKEPARQGGAGNTSGQMPVAHVVAFLWAHRGAYLSHFLGFAALGLFYNALFAWSPTLLIRRFALTAGEAGLYLGLVTLVFGVAGILAGGWLTDWFDRSGRSDGALRTGIVAAVGMVPFAITAPLMPGAIATIALYCPLMFFVSMPWAAAATGVQVATPDRMRAQASALYLFVLNLVGIGIGPTAAALITDHVFSDDNAVHYSLIIVGVAGAVLGALILSRGLAPFRVACDNAARTSAGRIRE